jgi:hypothetical protein
MMNKYSIQVLKYTFKKYGFLSAVKVAFKILRSKIWKSFHLVFEATTTLETLNLIKSYKENYVIENHEASDVSNQNLKNNLLNHHEALWDINELFRLKGKIWVGKINDEIANFGLSRSAEYLDKFYFPLTKDSVFLSNFVTFKKYQGQGLYPMLLTHMLDTLTKEGFQHFYIDCSEWNIPSIHGIQRAGFKLTSCFWKNKHSGQFETKKFNHIEKDKLYIVL